MLKKHFFFLRKRDVDPKQSLSIKRYIKAKQRRYINKIKEGSPKEQKYARAGKNSTASQKQRQYIISNWKT